LSAWDGFGFGSNIITKISKDSIQIKLERKFFIENIGEITFTKRKGNKRLTLRVRSSGEVRVSMPWFVSYDQALEFVRSKETWILTTREKLVREKGKKIPYTEENLPQTKYHKLALKRSSNSKMKIIIREACCEITIPQSLELRSNQVQEFIRFAYIETLRKEAKIHLVQRACELAKSYGFNIQNIRIKNMKTRWGSCSTKGNINLNLHLMQLPSYLSDYVILHELVHTVHHNHGPKFWAELEKYVDNPKKLSKELRQKAGIINK